MKKIKGVNMNTITCLKSKNPKDKISERYNSVYNALKESLKEVKLHKEGKIQLDTWDNFYKELKEGKE